VAATARFWIHLPMPMCIAKLFGSPVIHYRKGPVGSDDVPQDAGFFRLNYDAHRGSCVDLGLVPVALEHMDDLLAKLIEVFVLVLELNYFFSYHFRNNFWRLLITIA